MGNLALLRKQCGLRKKAGFNETIEEYCKGYNFDYQIVALDYAIKMINESIQLSAESD